jgi:endoglucanase
MCLGNDVVIGKSLDDRAGCTVAIRALEELFATGAPELPVQIVALFSTFEEVGGRGAQAASFDVDPDLALVLEGTIAADCPGVPAARCPSRQGSGPALTLMDRTAHLPRTLVREIEDIAREAGIPCQLKTPIFGGTNAARIHMVRAGVPTAVMSVPCRYIHGPNSMLRLEDLRSTIRLVVDFLRRADIAL